MPFKLIAPLSACTSSVEIDPNLSIASADASSKLAPVIAELTVT